MVKKYFVLDTNVLVNDPNAFKEFPVDTGDYHTIIIPGIVLKELDNLKMKSYDPLVSARAQEVIKSIDRFCKEYGSDGGNLANGIMFRDNYEVKVQFTYDKNLDSKLEAILENDGDGRILKTAYHIQEQHPNNYVEVVSEDVSVRIRAGALNLNAKSKTDSRVVDFDDLYKGYEQFESPFNLIKELRSNGFLDANIFSEYDFQPNEFVSLRVKKGASSELAMYSSHNNTLVKLNHSQSGPWNLKHRNLAQRLAFEHLNNQNLQLVSLMGPAGTGKTLLAIAAGLDSVMRQGLYKTVKVTRPIIPMGGDIGYLPGGIDEKMKRWMQPIYDNLDFLVQSSFEGDGSLHECFKEYMSDIRFDLAGFTRDQKLKKDSDIMTAALFESGVIEIEPLTYIRGRSLPDIFFIVDESQNLTTHEAKTIITRAGEGTRVIFTGDPYQIDTRYLNADNNGLSVISEKFKDWEKSGHIVFQKSERSELADEASRRLM